MCLSEVVYQRKSSNQMKSSRHLQTPRLISVELVLSAFYRATSRQEIRCNMINLNIFWRLSPAATLGDACTRACTHAITPCILISLSLTYAITEILAPSFQHSRSSIEKRCFVLFVQPRLDELDSRDYLSLALLSREFVRNVSSSSKVFFLLLVFSSRARLSRFVYCHLIMDQ